MAVVTASDCGPSVVDRLGASAPEVRLPVKMAAARGVSERRGSRLSPWLDGDRGSREPDDCPSATVAGGPSCVWASEVTALLNFAEAGNEGAGGRRAVHWSGWQGTEARPGFGGRGRSAR
ncbi:hypothetical protein [Thalassospira xiamenensis]|uniref:hypothetical protein n=1 Tax=Thalassospira xiamenensis TaxID=220697 RepID=UPI003AA9334F